MMKRAFFLPLLLIVCLLAPVPAVPAETRNSISLAGNALPFRTSLHRILSPLAGRMMTLKVFMTTPA